jgi:hypothetical protein
MRPAPYSGKKFGGGACGRGPRGKAGDRARTDVPAAAAPVRALPVAEGAGRAAPSGDQLNRLETERSSLIRLIASAISGAMLS